MASLGPNFPGTTSTDNSVGSVAWNANTDNIKVEDGTDATPAAGVINTTQTNYIIGTNFNFAIPAGATINGITVEWKRQKVSGSGNAVDFAVRIVKGGVIGATDKSLGGQWPLGVETYATYGGAADLWGLAWTAADINASTFGAALSVQGTAAKTANVGVDAVRITVTYTAAATGTPTHLFMKV